MRRTSRFNVFTRFGSVGHNMPYENKVSQPLSSSPPQQQQEKQEFAYGAQHYNEEVGTSFPERPNKQTEMYNTHTPSSNNSVTSSDDIMNNQTTNSNVNHNNNNKYGSGKGSRIMSYQQKEEQQSAKFPSSSSSSSSSSQWLPLYDQVSPSAFGAGGMIASARILYSQRERLDLRFLSNYAPNVNLMQSPSSSTSLSNSPLPSSSLPSSSENNAVFVDRNVARSVRAYSHSFLLHKNKHSFTINTNSSNNSVSKEIEMEHDALKSSLKALQCRKKVTSYETKYYIERERPNQYYPMSHSTFPHQQQQQQQWQWQWQQGGVRNSVNSFPAVFVEHDITTRQEMYKSYEQLFIAYVEHRLIDGTALLYHTEAPAPAIVLCRLLSECTPSLYLVQHALMSTILSMQNAVTDKMCTSFGQTNNNININKNSNNNSAHVNPMNMSAAAHVSSAVPSWRSSFSVEAIDALHHVWYMLKHNALALYKDTAVRVLLLECLLLATLVNEVIDVLRSIPLCKLTERLWRMLVEFATETKLPHSMYLWHLLNVSASPEISQLLPSSSSFSSSESSLSSSSQPEVENDSCQNDEDRIESTFVYSRVLTSSGVSKLIPSSRSVNERRECDELPRLSPMLEFKDVIGWERDDAEVEQSDSVNENVVPSAIGTESNNNSYCDILHHAKMKRTAPSSPLAVHSSSIVPVIINTGSKIHKNMLLSSSDQNYSSNNDIATEHAQNIHDKIVPIESYGGAESSSYSSTSSTQNQLECVESKDVDSQHNLGRYAAAAAATTIHVNLLRWCLLSSNEVCYSREHYGCDSTASADDRAEDVWGMKLFVSAAEYESVEMADRNKLTQLLLPEENKPSGVEIQNIAVNTSTSSTTASSINTNALYSIDASKNTQQIKMNVETLPIRLLSLAMEKLIAGSKYALDAKLTTALLLRPGISFAGQSSPLLAIHILKRYLNSCRSMRDEATTTRSKIKQELEKSQTWRHKQQLQQQLQLQKTRTSNSFTHQNSLQESELHNNNNDGTVNNYTVINDSTEHSITFIERKKNINVLEKHADALSKAAAPHPSPFFVFFQILRDTRDVVAQTDEQVQSSGHGSPIRLRLMTINNNDTNNDNSSATESTTNSAGDNDEEDKLNYSKRLFPVNVPLPMVHWELAWGFFQLLNRENPTWYTLLDPDECSELIMYLLELLCRGVDPWMCLNVARRAAALHLVDTVEVSLWLLHRLDSSHHLEEAREVATQIFRWLLADVGMHLQPAMHHQLIPCARVLIRFNLHDELRSLYNAVLDNVYTFSENFRDEFLSVMSDLTCASCACILPSANLYVDRVCPNCLFTTPAKNVGEMPSFQLSAEHMQLIRDKRKEARYQARQKMYSRLNKFNTQTELTSTGSSNVNRSGNSDSKMKLPLDAAEFFKRALLNNNKDNDDNVDNRVTLGSRNNYNEMIEGDWSKYLLLPGVSMSETASLFPTDADDDNENNKGSSMLGKMNNNLTSMTSSTNALSLFNGKDSNEINNQYARPVLLSPRAALEESNKRLAMQRAARLFALVQRGQLDAQALSTFTLPSLYSSSSSSSSLVEGVTPPFHTSSLPSRSLVPGKIPIEGAWTCVWCQEHNSEWSSRTHCGACGAETGPGASWRKFIYGHVQSKSNVKDSDGSKNTNSKESKQGIYETSKFANKAMSNTSGTMSSNELEEEKKVDVMHEVRMRIANSAMKPADAIAAGFLLMVYRRLFLLRATPHDFNRLNVLIERLCANQEKILAAYLYMRLLPSQLRCKDHVAYTLCALFGNSPTYVNVPSTPRKAAQIENVAQTALSCLETLTDTQMQKNEEVCFTAIFGLQTCKVCFGQHDWHTCPIITRDFSKTHRGVAINLTSSEKRADVMKYLRQRIRFAMQSGTASVKRIVDAYASFVSSAYRETFAQCYSIEVNELSILLSECKQYRRAAFVLCHVPLFARWNEAYMKFIHYFNVTADDAMLLLAPRPRNKLNRYKPIKSRQHSTRSNVLHTSGKAMGQTGAKENQQQQEEEEEEDVNEEEEESMTDEERLTNMITCQAEDALHPNFVQVAMTCCMCLDEKHASFHCPRLLAWLDAVHKECYSSSPLLSTYTYTAGGSKPEASKHSQQTLKRLRAQVDGWINAGPERLHAFYRFLLEHIDLYDELFTTRLISSSTISNTSNLDINDNNKWNMSWTEDRFFTASPSPSLPQEQKQQEHLSNKSRRNVNWNEPLIYALNRTVVKLAVMHKRSEAYRLYARAPVRCVAASTIIALLKLNGYRAESIQSMLYSPTLHSNFFAISSSSSETSSSERLEEKEEQQQYDQIEERLRGNTRVQNNKRVALGEEERKEANIPDTSNINYNNEDNNNAKHRVMSATEAHASLIAKYIRSFTSSDSILSHRYNNYAEVIDDQITPTQTARTAAVPLHSVCYICFEHSHAFFDCPELLAQSTEVAKLFYILTHVGKLRFSPVGVNAAANYVYYVYNRGRLLSPESWRAQPELVKQLLQLIHRCFVLREVACGVRILRRMPLEMVPIEPTYVELWQSAGLSHEVVQSRRLEMLALYDAEGVVPSLTSPSVRKSYSNKFMSLTSRALHDELCRHCFMSTHGISTCGVFHAEVSFGRDYVAAYRMSMMSEQLDRDWQDAYLLKLIIFHYLHLAYMPYHIVGVTNALNAIAAMWSFRGEPGIALWHLLNIPPAYRRRTAFKHILYSLNISMKEITETLSHFYFAPDEMSGSSSASGSGISGGVIAQHLLLPKAAIRDVALKNVFEHFPAAMSALDESLTRMKRIAVQHQAFGKRTNHNTENSNSTDAKMKLSSSSSSLYEPYKPITSSKVSNPEGNNKNSDDSSESKSANLIQQMEHYKGNERVWSTEVTSIARMLAIHSSKMQSGDINVLRENFDPILSELEDAVGMKLGSRHILFTTAIDILGSSILNNSDNVNQKEESRATSVAPTDDISNNKNKDNNDRKEANQNLVSSQSVVNTQSDNQQRNEASQINMHVNSNNYNNKSSSTLTSSSVTSAMHSVPHTNVTTQNNVDKQSRMPIKAPQRPDNDRNMSTNQMSSEFVQSSFAKPPLPSSFVAHNNSNSMDNSGQYYTNHNDISTNYARQQGNANNSPYTNFNSNQMYSNSNVYGNGNTTYRGRGRGNAGRGANYHSRYSNNMTTPATSFAPNQRMSPSSTWSQPSQLPSPPQQQQQAQPLFNAQRIMPETSFAQSPIRNRGRGKSEPQREIL